jgi:hypothetical protein
VYNGQPEQVLGVLMSTVEVYGRVFLRCDKEDCAWNVGYTPHDLNRHGLWFTARKGTGVRLCNFGLKALAYGGDIDRACPHKAELCSVLGIEDASPEGRFWGRVDPEVAGRALGKDPERPT